MKKLKFDSYDGVCFFEWTCLFCAGCVAGKNAGWCVGTRIFHPSGIIVRRDFSGGNSNRIYNR